MIKRFSPVHPCEVLLAEFLRPLGISQCRLARDISVPPRHINEIVHGKRSVTADTALRLSRYFGLSDRFWLDLQAHYDIEVAKDRFAGRLDAEVTPSLPTASPPRSRRASAMRAQRALRAHQVGKDPRGRPVGTLSGRAGCTVRAVRVEAASSYGYGGMVYRVPNPEAGGVAACNVS